MVSAKMGLGLVVSWRELTVYEEISWLGDVVAWVEIGWEVGRYGLWGGCTYQGAEVVRVWVVVLMHLVDGILLDDSAIVGDVRCFEVVGCRVVDVTIAVGENGWHSLWWGCDGRRKSMVVISVYIVEDVVVSDVIPSEDVSPLVLRQRTENLCGLVAVKRRFILR